MDNSEEFSQQLNERMPLAMRAMEKATGKTSKELRKMMEEGQLGLDVLPKFGRALRELANDNNALDKAILTARVQENRLIQQFQKSADKVFRSGFEEGLVKFYKTLSEELKDTGKSQEDLGNIYKNFFNLITKSVKVITPLLESLIQVTSKLTDVIMLSINGWQNMFQWLNVLPTPLKMVALAISAVALSMKSVIAKGLTMLAVFQEVASLFDDKLVGVLEAKMGTQFNLKTFQQTGLERREGGFFSTGESQSMFGTTEGKAVMAGFAALATLTPLYKTLIEVIKKLTLAILGKNAIESSIGKSSYNKTKRGSSKISSNATTAAVMGSLTKAGAMAASGAMLASGGPQTVYAAYRTNENKEAILDSARSGDLGSRAQRALLRADQANMQRQMSNMSTTSDNSTSVVLENLNVNINGSNLNSEEAGRRIADVVKGELEREVAIAIRGGRR